MGCDGQQTASTYLRKVTRGSQRFLAESYLETLSFDRPS